ITPPAALLILFVGRAAEVTCTSERVLKKQVLHSRRHNKRVETPQGVWVLWRCGRTEDTSRVKDLSVGGLFIETSKVCPVDATVELHFLVEDGERPRAASNRRELRVATLGHVGR